MARSVPLSQAADEMAVCQDTVRRLLDRGELRGHRVGAAIRVFAESLDDYQRRHEVTPRLKAMARPQRRANRGHQRAMQDLERLGI